MAWIVRSNGDMEELRDLSLESLQRAVGGLIEVVLTHNGCEMVINEEGKLRELPINVMATLCYRYGSDDPIVGDVVVLAPGETLR